MALTKCSAAAATIPFSAMAAMMSSPGGAGNDTLVGGGGIDTAIFSGNLGEYTVALLAGGDFEVRDSRTGAPDGTDRLNGDIEQLAFANGITTPADLAVVRNARSDFDGDGRSDVAWLHSSGAFTSWAGRPGGAFVDNGGFGANLLDASWQVAGIGDFNGDGNDDLLWRHTTGEIGQWQGQSTGAFGNISGFAANAVDNSWSVVAVGDYNGDGHDDIFWRHDSGEITEWIAQPGGSFVNNSAAAVTAIDLGWSVVASGDFNGDGRADVLWRHSSGEFVEWQGTPTGALVNAGSVMAGAAGTVIGSADFNDDGRDDVLNRNANGSITEWIAQASGQFAAVTPNLQVNDFDWDVVGLGDYNGDGFSDLLWRHSSGEGAQWFGTASGEFFYNDIVIPMIDPSWQIQAPDIFMV